MRTKPATPGVPSPALDTFPDDLKPLVHYLDAHFAEPDLNVTQALHACSMQSPRVHFRFRSATGVTIREYYTWRRIERAAVLLRQDGRALIEVAMEVGYLDYSTFERNFKERMGLSPRDFRLQQQRGDP